ncbi:NapC/NirT family cytochrome c [Thiovibrio sp. JS02]
MHRQGGIILTLLRVIFRRPATLVGATIFALLFPILVLSTLIDLQGGIENPYFSLFIYLILGPLALVALILMVAGLVRARSKVAREPYTYEFFKEQLTNPERCKGIRRLVYTATILVAAFLLFLGVVAYSGHRYTDSTQFCGTFCHTVMAPEFTTFKNSPHSQVPCVACHIGKDAQGAAKAKFTGLKQLYSTLFNAHERPLKTPLASLRPSRKLCEECHRPEKFHGHMLYFIDSFLPDEANSHVQTAMIMKIGSGGYLGRSAQGIHWHISEQHQLFYEAADREGKEITRVVLQDAAGVRTVYRNKNYESREKTTGGSQRLMDCVDCHNRPTHVFLAPGPALDQKILAGQIPAELPFIKREALAVITRQYPDPETARQAIADQLRQWYGTHYPELTASRSDLLAQAVAGTQQAYAENVFPEMNIHWETYQSFIGHRNGSGCFRCHNDAFTSEDGKVISRDCDLCHLILAEKAPAEKSLEMFRNLGR